jgi:hypothetical protein
METVDYKVIDKSKGASTVYRAEIIPYDDPRFESLLRRGDFLHKFVRLKSTGEYGRSMVFDYIGGEWFVDLELGPHTGRYRCADVEFADIKNATPVTG